MTVEAKLGLYLLHNSSIPVRLYLLTWIPSRLSCIASSYNFLCHPLSYASQNALILLLGIFQYKIRLTVQNSTYSKKLNVSHYVFVFHQILKFFVVRFYYLTLKTSVRIYITVYQNRSLFSVC